MSLLLLVVWLVCALTIVAFGAAMVVHFYATGSLFSLVRQRLQQQLAESTPKLCGHCGGNIPASAANCPACGGPRSSASPRGGDQPAALS